MDVRCGGAVMNAGDCGAWDPAFFRSARIARKARFPCSRRMHSMYSMLGLVAVVGVAAFVSELSAGVEGDPVLASWIGDACCDGG